MGKSRPAGVPSSWWLARPTRWRNVPIDRGDPIWQTSSTGPTSIPSSSDAVATSARSEPARSRASTSRRRSADRLPWCAATTKGSPSPSGPDSSRSASWWATRSASLRVFTKTRVVRCSRTSAAIRSRISPNCPPGATASSSASGSSIATSRPRRCPQSTISGIGRVGPTPQSSRATTSSGFWVADSPMRCKRPPSDSTRWASRSRLRARWLPRLSRASVWTSSTMTVRTLRSIERDEAAVRSRYSDSGVVTRRFGGDFCMARRSAGGVSPVLVATVTSGTGSPSRSASARMPSSGTNRFSCTSAARARSGDT